MDSEVRLTVLGLYLSENVERAKFIVGLIQRLAEVRAMTGVGPFDKQDPQATRLEILGHMPDLRRIREDIVPMLRMEPPTASVTLFGLSQDEWALSLPRSLRGFDQVSAVPPYVEALATTLIQPLQLPERLFSSPFTLPAAIDYLNVEANVQDSVRNLEATILSSIPSADAEGAYTKRQPLRSGAFGSSESLRERIASCTVACSRGPGDVRSITTPARSP